MSQRKNNILSESKDQKKPEQAKVDIPSEADWMPKFLGMDYFRLIYMTAAGLFILMLVIYFTLDDD